MTRRCQRALALTLSLTTVLFLVPMPAWSIEPARLAGKVFEADGATPRNGVVVALYDTRTESTYRSDPTGEDGAFLLQKVPAGEYSLVAESEGGAFLADEALTLEPGVNEPLALTLKTTPNYYKVGMQRKGLKPWAKWFIAGTIAATALYYTNKIVEDTEEDSSPF